MIDNILALIPVIASTGAIGLIGKVTIAILKKLPKKTNENIKAIEEQNKILRKENNELKEFIKFEEKVLENVLNNQNSLNERLNKEDISRQTFENQTKTLINEATTIRNELRTLLKKED